MSASCDHLVFHTTQRCHSVFSCFAPAASFHDRLVASENVATRLPPVVDRTSGSLPRFPIRVTLFKLRLIHSSWTSYSLLARTLKIKSDTATSFHCTTSAFQLHVTLYFKSARNHAGATG